MWIFLNDADLSIVAHRATPDLLLVRSRTRESLERLFPAYEVLETPAPPADYLFRVAVPRREVARVLFARLKALDYDNFKSSVRDLERHDAYLKVWGVMRGLQRLRQGIGEVSRMAAAFRRGDLGADDFRRHARRPAR